VTLSHDGLEPGHGRRLLEIPVYRVSPDTWRSEQQEGADDIHADWEEAGISAPNLEERAYGLYRDSIGPYEYNQIVAIIRLIWDEPGAVVKAYYSRVDQVRFTRNFRRQRPFVWRGKLFELWFDESDDSLGIAAQIRDELTRQTQDGEVLAKMFVDLEPFDNLAASINWRLLIGLDSA
jgi:hypothetical protein